jgi:hypothetical protein
VVGGDGEQVRDRRQPLGTCSDPVPGEIKAGSGYPAAGSRKKSTGSSEVNTESREVSRGSREVNPRHGRVNGGQTEVNPSRGSSEARFWRRQIDLRTRDARRATLQSSHRRLKARRSSRA